MPRRPATTMRKASIRKTTDNLKNKDSYTGLVGNILGDGVQGGPKSKQMSHRGPGDTSHM